MRSRDKWLTDEQVSILRRGATGTSWGGDWVSNVDGSKVSHSVTGLLRRRLATYSPAEDGSLTTTLTATELGLMTLKVRTERVRRLKPPEPSADGVLWPNPPSIGSDE